MIDFSAYELISFPAELDAELAGQGDRGLAVLGSAGLEFLLEGLVKATMADSAINAKELFSGTGPLATLSSRIAIAHALGLVSRDEFADLQIIRKVRNSLTHTVSGGSFSSQANHDLCRNLVLGERLYAPTEIPFADLGNGKRGVPRDVKDYPVLPEPALHLPDKDDPRARFAASVRVLARVLSARTAMAEQRTVPDEFISPEEPLAVPLALLRVQLEEIESIRREVRDLQDDLMARGKPVPEELSKLLREQAERSKADKQIEMLLAMGEYSNEVIRISHAAAQAQDDNAS